MDERDVIKPGTHHPFTRDDAAVMGLSRWMLRTGPYRRVMRGVYIHERIPDALPVRARAAQLIAPPGGILSHGTAASLWCPRVRRSAEIHLAYRGTGQPTHRTEVRVHRFTYPLERRGRHGLYVTSPGMTFMHLAVHWDLVELTAFGDMLIKREIMTADELIAYANAWEWHGARAGRDAAALARARVESVPESHLRLLLVLAGFPEPVVNYTVPGAQPGATFRLDLAYPEVLVAVEYDGRWHRTKEQRALDEARRQLLRARGWEIIVVEAEGLYETPEETLDRIEEVLTSRGMSLPKRTGDHLRYFGTTVALEDNPYWV
ncbi:MAG: DUF559 domain-containing protein [Actinomycetia bacterium]|nr:DUF559 domain-containing protein [Actinomycetes bacterium]